MRYTKLQLSGIEMLRAASPGAVVLFHIPRKPPHGGPTLPGDRPLDPRLFIIYVCVIVFKIRSN